nr:hypothetical protein [Tanacetum cinerariifolium]
MLSSLLVESLERRWLLEDSHVRLEVVVMDDDTLSEERIRTTPSMVSHIDEIVQTVSIQDKPSSYVVAAGGSKPEPSKTKANFRSLSLENLCEGVNFSVPRKVKIHDVPIQVFSKNGLSIIASQMGKLIILDSHTSSMCIESWESSSFARCLIEINADDVLKKSLIMGVPLIKFGGHSVKQNFRNEPKATTNVPMKGATNMGNASKPGLFEVSTLLKNQPLKAIVPPNKVGNITTSNLYVALDDESEEDVKNVYDESANLLNSTKTGGSSSTFTVAAG